MNTKTQSNEKPNSVCFIMNIIDQRSIAISTLFQTALKEKGVNVKLTDVRDVLPVSDLYIWINSGSLNDLKTFLPLNCPYADIHGNRVSSRELIERSIFLIDSSSVSMEKPGLVVTALLQRLQVLFDLTEEEKERIEAMYWIINTHSAAWAACTGGELEGVAAYNSFLQACYKNYKRSYLSVEKIKEILSSKETESFLELNQSMNDTFSRRVQMTAVLGDTTVYLTFIDEEIYAVIRRILSSKHKFYHHSEGLCGPVVFTNIAQVVKMGDRPTLMLHSV